MTLSNLRKIAEAATPVGQISKFNFETWRGLKTNPDGTYDLPPVFIAQTKEDAEFYLDARANTLKLLDAVERMREASERFSEVIDPHGLDKPYVTVPVAAFTAWEEALADVDKLLGEKQ